MDEKPLLEVKDISKIFGATTALSGISLTVQKGSVHSLLGRNGAGKSTLVNIIAGIYPPSSGEVLFEGQDIANLNIFQRQELGIRLVPQHENSFPDLSVAENIFAGVLPKNKGVVDWAQIYKRAQEELESYGLRVDPHSPVRDLSSIDARKLNIIRAMHSGAKLIILDEPTTALSTQERGELFEFVEQLRAQGTAFIFISHYLGEVLKLSESITVLRDGKMYPAGDRSTWNEEKLANLVAGEDVELTRRDHTQVTHQAPYVVAENLSTKEISDVNLEIFGGEILGVVGFPGSGAREFCRTLFGLHPLTSGRLVVNGEDKSLKSPKAAVKAGIAYISFDRHREGIIPTMNIASNVSLSVLSTRIKGKFGTISARKQKALAHEYRDNLKIKSNSISDPIESLSGGNQQKVIVSRLLATNPKLLVLDEPTIGIDIKSREEIISKVNELTKDGMSTVYLTNDYEELLRVADRLAFFRDGRLVAVVPNNSMTIDELTEIRDK